MRCNDREDTCMGSCRGGKVLSTLEEKAVFERLVEVALCLKALPEVDRP